MELLDAVKKRYSCRAYQDKPVDETTLNKILDVARLAPSAKNFQDWRFVVVTDKQTRAELSIAAANQAFVAQAPVVIACCSTINHWMRCGQPTGSIDVAIAMEHIALAAVSLGLATCWIGSFFPDEVRKILHIPTHIHVVELLTLGWPADKQPEMKRLPLDAIVCREKWAF
ncbi:MAG: nitroreductase [Planctomycetes bacterium]|nr:nitroreductase [Planctomycetota bacterium]